MPFFSQAGRLEILQLVTNTRSTGPSGANPGAFVSRQRRATSETSCFPNRRSAGPALTPSTMAKACRSNPGGFWIWPRQASDSDLQADALEAPAAVAKIGQLTAARFRKA